jgi:hypothetical protein
MLKIYLQTNNYNAKNEGREKISLQLGYQQERQPGQVEVKGEVGGQGLTTN